MSSRVLRAEDAAVSAPIGVAFGAPAPTAQNTRPAHPREPAADLRIAIVGSSEAEARTPAPPTIRASRPEKRPRRSACSSKLDPVLAA